MFDNFRGHILNVRRLNIGLNQNNYTVSLTIYLDESVLGTEDLRMLVFVVLTSLKESSIPSIIPVCNLLMYLIHSINDLK